jgi:dipeptidyl-peptidase 4
MKKTIAIFCFLLISGLSVAQDKLFTMEEAVYGARTTLRPKNLPGIQFIPGTSSYAYVDVSQSGELLVKANAETNEKQTVFTADEVKTKLKALNETGRFSLASMKWNTATTFLLTAGQTVYEVDVTTKSIKSKGKDNSSSLENADKSESSDKIAFTKSGNLFILDNGQEIAVTDDKTEGIVYGASNVHRNEFGISKGTFWSPKGNALAFYKMDQRMVKDYPVVNWGDVPALEKKVKYPMAGEKSHLVTLGVYNISKRLTTYLKTADDDHYLTNIAWSPDEKSIYIAELNRDQNHMKMNEYDAATGEFKKTLFEEKDEKYVEPMDPIQFVKNNPSQFIWLSRKDGFYHAYLYDITGKQLKQLTSGAWEILSLNGFDEKGEKLFYHANAASPVHKDLYAVTLKDAKSQKITNGDGVHNCLVDDKGTYVIDEFTNLTTPKTISVVSVKNKKETEIFRAVNPLKDFALGKVSLFQIKNKDGIDLWCRMYKPVNFDSTKKYPAIVYLYGGPHHQEVMNSFNGSGNLWFQYMAERGYVVFTLDNRGSGNRGKAFEQATFRNLGTEEMEDQLKGVEFLKSQPYIDASRIGVHGWSFGGFMTTSLMTRKPGTFKVGVGGGPVIDWSMYEVMYTERYMDSPQSNPEGFKKSSLFQYIPDLKGKLLLIHGTDDDVVVWQHSIKYLKCCVDKNVQLDYFVYPGHPHNVQGRDRIHLMQKITDYFVQNL